MPSRKSIKANQEIDAPRIRAIRRRLLAWFDVARRDLPWRRTTDPYLIWLSEAMLQQTQVATVVPYYNKFLDHFPTVGELAAADLDAVLKLWAGLGYYARARNLHRAAQAVVDQHNGQFPRTALELRGLPGVGAYTAGAVASIAFNERAPVVDGNVARVFARLFRIEINVQAGPGRDRLWQIAERLVPADRPGDFNQALMELGATVCLPKQAARCLTCPLQSQCAAFAAGVVAELPLKKVKTPVKAEVHVVAAIIDSKNRWLVVQRPVDGLWGGLWELPTTVSETSRSRIDSAMLAEMLADGLIEQDVETESQPFCDVTHQLTHRTVRFVGHVCRVVGRGSNASEGRKNGKKVQPNRDLSFSRSITRPTKTDLPFKWLDLREIGTIGISTAMQKVLEALSATNGEVVRKRLAPSV